MKSNPLGLITSVGMDVIALTSPGDLIRASIENAISLIEDAEILYKSRRYPRSNLLALLAVEEIAKAKLINDHHQIQRNVKLKKDLVSHTVKFGSKDQVLKMKRKNISFILKGNGGAGKDKERREDSMYVGVKDSKIVSPAEIKAPEAKASIRRAKEELFYMYLNNHLTLWPQYDNALPKPPPYIKISSEGSV